MGASVFSKYTHSKILASEPRGRVCFLWISRSFGDLLERMWWANSNLLAQESLWPLLDLSILLRSGWGCRMSAASLCQRAVWSWFPVCKTRLPLSVWLKELWATWRRDAPALNHSNPTYICVHATVAHSGIPWSNGAGVSKSLPLKSGFINAVNFICISSVSAYILNLFIIKQKSLSSNALFIAVFVLPIFKEQIMTSKLMVQFNSIQ